MDLQAWSGLLWFVAFGVPCFVVEGMWLSGGAEELGCARCAQLSSIEIQAATASGPFSDRRGCRRGRLNERTNNGGWQPKVTHSEGIGTHVAKGQTGQAPLRKSCGQQLKQGAGPANNVCGCHKRQGRGKGRAAGLRRAAATMPRDRGRQRHGCPWRLAP